MEYALYPHEKGWQEGRTVKKAYALNYPLISIMTNKHTGSLPSAYSFVRLKPSNLILTTIKKSEQDPDTWIFQWYDSEGIDTKAVLKLTEKPKRAVISNFLEEDLMPLQITGNEIHVPIKKNGICTIKIYWE